VVGAGLVAGGWRAVLVADGQWMVLAAGERRLAKQTRRCEKKNCRRRRIEGSEYQLLGQYSIRVESSLLEALDLLLNQIFPPYMSGFCLYLYARGLQTFYLSYNSKLTRTPNF
jgi:hypothetical protein